MKVLNEIKLFSSLYHPNIVNYHNCWIEHTLVPEEGNKKKKKDKDKKKRNLFSDSLSTGPKIQLLDDDDSEMASSGLSQNKKSQQRHKIEFPISTDNESSSDEGFFAKSKKIEKTSTINIDVNAGFSEDSSHEGIHIEFNENHSGEGAFIQPKQFEKTSTINNSDVNTGFSDVSHYEGNNIEINENHSVFSSQDSNIRFTKSHSAYNSQISKPNYEV